MEDKINTNIANQQRISQLILINQLRNAYNGKVLSFSEVGFRQYSQNLEDGIILYIFSLIDSSNKICVEMCAANGIQCNSANLIINHGWNGILFDGDRKLIEEGTEFYSNHRSTSTFPPKLINAWITAENVNDVLLSNGASGEIDLLSLDLDGVDYWIWKAINCVSPRVVIVETQCIWGNEKSVTVPYSPDFTAQFVNGFGVYSGASLLAFIKLFSTKGYRLVGLEPFGFNAFFMRNDVGKDIFPAISIDQATKNFPFIHWAQKELLPLVVEMEWQEV